MLAACVAPEVLRALLGRRVLMFDSGPNLTWDVAGMLAALPGVAAFALLAPLVGYRRRDALLMLVPVVQFYPAWVVGARAVQLRPGDDPRRWDGSAEATGMALLVTGVLMAAYATWVIVLELYALP